jgi:NADH dehydrogenase FAD-containing subunit
MPERSASNGTRKAFIKALHMSETMIDSNRSSPGGVNPQKTPAPRVDKEKRCVFVNSPDGEHVPVPYDYLILATGVRHSYFKHNEFEKYFPRASGLTVRSDRSLSPARTDKESND